MTRHTSRASLAAIVLLTTFVVGAQDPIKPMVGKWRAMLSYTEGGGRFTAGLAEDTEVKQIDPNTIGFSMKPVIAERPMFEVRLTHKPAAKNYVLSVKTNGTATIDGLVLSSGAAGLSGEGMLNDSTGKPHKVQASITTKSSGEYEWSFLDPAAPPKNNIVFSFTFFKRL